MIAANYYSLGNRCYTELIKTFVSAGATSREKHFADGDLEGLMQWVLSENRAYKSFLSAREYYCAWIGARRTTLVLMKAGCIHLRTCTNPDSRVSADHVQRLTVEPSECSKKFLSNI
jgi:hypothetical protein